MSWRVTLACNRAEAEALPESEELFPLAESPPVIVADEPDPAKPDEWLIHAYFADQPVCRRPGALRTLAAGSTAEVEHLGEDDWVTMSQAGLEPIRAGRFFVHTPTHRDAIPEGATAFEIDAGLAFGTGHHHTTAGCLAALDRLQVAGKQFANIADIGTGTGLLAFAALIAVAAGQRRSRPTSTRFRSTSPPTMPRSTASPSAMARANCCSGSPTAWITR